MNFIREVILTALELLNGTSTWIVVSYIIAGLLHDVISPVRFQRGLGNTKFSSIVKATLSAMIIPICSCGSVPLGISLYYSGAYLGPTLAFLASSPFLNPAAIIMSLGLLGWEITLINIIAGLFLPLLIGVIGNKIGGDELRKPMLEEEIVNISLEESDDRSLVEKFKSGLIWVTNDLALTLSKYTVLGMLLGGLILSIFPESFIQEYLGNPSLLSLMNVAVMGTIMYVCAVGHIPFIAALIVSGASPGSAITFLMAGAATNVPELYSIYKMIGKKTAAIYGFVVTIYAFIIGYITNLILMPGFKPVADFSQANKSIEIANRFQFTIPDPINWICTVILLMFFMKSIRPFLEDVAYKVKGFFIED